MSENTYEFQKLTPVTNAEMAVYEEAMKYILSNGDIRNIAISGAYGAGKSSVIETYKEQHKEIKFLHISLAHFENDESTNINNSVKETNCNETVSVESVLEGKILNQLIHQIKPESILQTNFRIKTENNKKRLVFQTIEIVFFLFLSLFIKFNNKWCNIENGMSVKI